MVFIINDPPIFAGDAAARQAAEILRAELTKRLGHLTQTGPFGVALETDARIENDDAFRIRKEADRLVFSARGLRGLIYAVGLFLRKTEYRDGGIRLVREITGFHAPAKPIRGHQLGYRAISNTYDKWSPADFRRYALEQMFFGMNTVEHIPGGDDETNDLMELTPQALLSAASADAHALGLRVSLWLPNREKDPEEALKNREKIFAGTPYIDALFVPGSDPGDLPAAELFARTRTYAALLRQTHPDAEVWISAQAPHNAPDWGEAFLAETAKRPAFLTGVITGPNRAFDIETLRRRLPENFPIRFYPDITHNLRCEHPVHFRTDDWHFAFCAALSRECVNPRPAEYAALHRQISPYTVGSVSYSEGVNDDVNKAVWCALEWDPDASVREILEDWARLYLYEADAQTAADAVAGLECNWIGAPETNPEIDHTLDLWAQMENKETRDNWRFLQGIFRARCDKYIKDKRVFETALLRDARALLLRGDNAGARAVLQTPLPPETAALRQQITADADALFRTVGMQLSVSRHGASGWERGATLDTLDLPVTDLPWLLRALDEAKDGDPHLAERAVRRNEVRPDEFYFSFALSPIADLGAAQDPDHYMDVQADRPDVNDGGLPTCLFKLFDHYTLRLTRGGFLPGTDYVLTVTYKNTPNGSRRHTVTANGRVLYRGAQFGGTQNEDLAPPLLPERLTAVDYPLPADVFENGCLRLEISEPERGFETAEITIRRKP